jgi:predicted Zn-dependent protease
MPLTPVAVEVSAADKMAPDFEAQYGGTYLNPPVQAYIRQVGGRLAAAGSRPDFPHKYQVLADAKTINAFALGNGNIYITLGLLKLLDDEAELAEVLGHETGHVDHRHMAEKMDASFGFKGLTSLLDKLTGGGSISDALDKAVNVTQALTINGFGRDQELDADATGLTYMASLGYDPYGSVRVFQKFQKLEGAQPGLLQKYFMSHPTALVRIDDLTKVLDQNYPGVKGETYRDRFQNIVNGVPMSSGAAVADFIDQNKTALAVAGGVVAIGVGAAILSA